MYTWVLQRKPVNNCTQWLLIVYHSKETQKELIAVDSSWNFQVREIGEDNHIIQKLDTFYTACWQNNYNLNNRTNLIWERHGDKWTTNDWHCY